MNCIQMVVCLQQIENGFLIKPKRKKKKKNQLGRKKKIKQSRAIWQDN